MTLGIIVTPNIVTVILHCLYHMVGRSLDK